MKEKDMHVFKSRIFIGLTKSEMSIEDIIPFP